MLSNMEDYNDYIIAKREYEANPNGSTQEVPKKSKYLPVSARNQYIINKNDIKVCR